MTDRRKFLGAMASAVLCAPFGALAQQQSARVPRIGFLGSESASNQGNRLEALRAVESDRRLEANFVLRRGFWAGASQDPSSLRQARDEYVRNMLDSDYVQRRDGAILFW